MKVIIRADFAEAAYANIEFDYPKQVEVYVDVEIKRNVIPIPENTVRFWVTSQPEGDYNELIKQNTDKYTYLLTAFDDLLSLPNAYLFIGCGSFVIPNPNIDKKFAVSTIMSGRNCLPGHKLRRELYSRRKEITIPFDFYLGTHNVLPDEFYTSDCIRLPGEKEDKIRAMDCMYHIAIDSYRRDNFYSEKLIDCLITKTIPIYWGCPNISNFFNSNGVILVASVDEIIHKVNILNAYDYELMFPVLEENYCLGLQHYKYEDILRRAILSCLH